MSYPRTRPHALVFTYAGAGTWLAGCSCGWQHPSPVGSFGDVEHAHAQHRDGRAVELLGVTS